jgi:hypothetical protein
MAQSLASVISQVPQKERSCIVKDIVGSQWLELKQQSSLMSRLPEFVENEGLNFLV